MIYCVNVVAAVVVVVVKFDFPCLVTGSYYGWFPSIFALEKALSRLQPATHALWAAVHPERCRHHRQGHVCLLTAGAAA